MTQDKAHTLLLTQNRSCLSILYSQLWPHGFAPLTIAPAQDAARDLFYQTALRLVSVDFDLPGCYVADLRSNAH